MLRLSIVDVSNHIERFEAVYRLAMNDPADGGVYEALVRHFTEYAISFIARCTHQDLPDSDRGVIGPVPCAWICRSDQGMAERQLSDERRPDLRHGRLCAGLVELRGAHGAVNRALYYGVELVDEVETEWGPEQYFGGRRRRQRDGAHHLVCASESLDQKSGPIVGMIR